MACIEKPDDLQRVGAGVSLPDSLDRGYGSGTRGAALRGSLRSDPAQGHYRQRSHAAGFGEHLQAERFALASCGEDRA